MRTLLTSDRTRSAIELVIFLVLAEIWLWSSASTTAYRVFAGAIIAIIVLRNVLRSNSDAWSAVRPLWSAPASWTVAVVVICVLVAGAIISAQLFYVEGEAWRLGRIERFFEAKQLASKIIIIVVQQIALCLFLFPSLYRISGSRKVAFLATPIIFGILHLPSLFLVIVTAAMAVVWLFLFERSQRLLPLIVIHFVLAVVATAVFPERLTYNLAVGQNAVPTAQDYERLTKGVLAGKYDEWKSDKYYQKNGSADRAFIVALYRDVLRRGASESEINAFLLKLRQTNRAEVVSVFMTSKEFLELRCRVDASCG